MTGETKKSGVKIFAVTIIIFIIAVLAIVGYPYYQTYIAPWYKPVLVVKDKTFNRKYFLKRLQVRLAGVEKNREIISFKLIEAIQTEELIRIEAEKRGLTVSKDEVAREVQRRVKKSTLERATSRISMNPC